MYTAAIVGAGFISTRKHLPAWLRLRRDVRVAAVCDLDLARAEAVRRQFGIPAAYADFREMLEKERPDFVDVCTPPGAHADIAVAALQADANVLIEKPFGYYRGGVSKDYRGRAGGQGPGGGGAYRVVPSLGHQGPPAYPARRFGEPDRDAYLLLYAGCAVDDRSQPLRPPAARRVNRRDRAARGLSVPVIYRANPRRLGAGPENPAGISLVAL